MARIGPTLRARFGIASIEDRVKIFVGAFEGSRFLETPMSTLFQRSTPVGEIAEGVYRYQRQSGVISDGEFLMKGVYGIVVRSPIRHFRQKQRLRPLQGGCARGCRRGPHATLSRDEHRNRP